MSNPNLLNFYCKSVFAFKSALLLFLLMTTGCDEPDMAGEIDYIIPEQPEMASGYIEKPGWEFVNYGVAAANPLAVDAGYQILSAGGSAVDAAIAVQLVLTLVEPQSSGIGGGAFMLFWDGEEVHAYNGRETAPTGADERQFLDENGEPLPYGQAIRSGLSVGVPGTLALLQTAHDNHGILPWEELFEPALTLAEQGFKVSPRLNRLLSADEALRKDEQAGSFYYDQDGNAIETGTLLKNPALAAILYDVAENGIESFYRGEAARDIARRVQNHERPGRMLASDIQAYLELDLRTEEICTPWKSYSVCGFPPPSSGHLTVMQILGMMEQLEMPETSLQDSIPTAEWLHLFLESSKLAFADRNQYIADARIELGIDACTFIPRQACCSDFRSEHGNG
jgi:gamma-glutamyltranspeptidase/glutathione hydrolase